MPKVINEAHVFAAVCKVFINHGYENTTTKELAEVAGMHEATLFRKYQSKAQLIIKAIEHEFSHVPLAQVSYTGDLEADLLSIVSAYVKTLHSHGDIMPLLLIEAPRHPELKEALAVPMRNIQALIQIIEQYQVQGFLINEDAMLSVAALFGPLVVKQMFHRANSVASPSEFDVRGYVALFLEGRKSR